MGNANVTNAKRREILLYRAWEWAAKVEGTNARALMPDYSARDFEPWDVHELALALQQLACCLHFIEQLDAPPAIRKAATAFKMAWADTPVLARDRDGTPLAVEGDPTLRELRNVLEHEADYIAGKGHIPGLVSSNWKGNGPGVITGMAGVEVFWIFGVSYDLSNVIAAALACKVALELAVGTPATPLPLASE